MSIVDAESALDGLTVREAMQRLRCYLDSNASIQQGIRHTLKYKINSILILDEKKNAIGMVSKTNMLGAYYVGLPITSPLSSIMVAPPITCRLNDSLDSALDVMRNRSVHRLYVLGDESNKVVGVLTYPDILGMLYKCCHRCERSTLRLAESGTTGKLADYFRVCELMNPVFRVHREDESLMKVMDSISAYHSGTVLIKSRDDLPQGVVSITDLIIAYMHGIPSHAAAKTIMSSPVLSCDYDEPLLMAIKKMIFFDLDSLYVHKDNSTIIVGLITLSDVARVRSGSCRACKTSRIHLDD
jgi:signal-transduction protein with cAMP-binding, CBS, and nucleotidyltransferase domain